MQLKSRSSGYAKRLLRVSNWLSRWLQCLDARRFLVVHDEGAVLQLCDAGVELAQRLSAFSFSSLNQQDRLRR